MTPNGFGNRFFLNRTPAWHNLGIVSQVDRSGVEALSDLGGGYWMEKRPVTVLLNGSAVETGDFAIVRSPVPDDPTERVFGYTTDRYKIFQPLEVVELFDQKVGAPVETLGMLGKGERLFITWKLAQTEVVKEDAVNWYGFCAIGFDAIMGASLSVVTTRVVCQNTWTSALAEAKREKRAGKGRGQLFSGKHNSENMKFRLGEWMNHVESNAKTQVQLTENFFARLAKQPIKNDSDARRLILNAFPDPEPLGDYPERLRKEKEALIAKEAEKVSRHRTGIEDLFFGKGTAITPDYWGLFNATTEWFNFGQMEKKPANVSILMGERATNMNKMAHALMKDIGG